MRTETTTAREDAVDVRDWALDQLASGVAVPIFRELPADLDTPVSAYLKLRDGSPSFLLESVEGGEHLGRYSFVGASPRAVVEFRDGAGTIARSDGSTERVAVDDPLTLIAAVLDERPVHPNPELPRFQGGAVGFLGYDAAARFERLPVPAHDPLGAPDGMWMYCEDLVVFDHVNQVMRIVSLALPDDDPVGALRAAGNRVARLTARIERPVPAAQPILNGRAESPIHASATRAEFERTVERAKEYIAAGDIIQVVPSVRLSRELAADAFDVYRALRRINPSPYMFHLDFGSLQLAGASPEMLVQSIGGTIRTRPIAGTLPRGSDEAADERLARELLADPKERAEHVMLVDLGRNDIGRVANDGSVQVDVLMEVERFSHVMHIVSDVSGELRPDLRGVDALRACFPAGTLTGAPKIRAMEIIAELEGMRRGPYGGAVGYVTYSGDLDTAITIRSMVVRDGKAHIQAGAGIVADSVPAREYDECLNKARAVIRAIEMAEGR